MNGSEDRIFLYLLITVFTVIVIVQLDVVVWVAQL
nr:MAG TPA: hypothetical protein [Caudoviricetes sp.]